MRISPSLLVSETAPAPAGGPTGRSNGNSLTLGAHGVLADWIDAEADRTQRKAGVNWDQTGMGSGSDYTAAAAATTDITGAGNAWIDLNITDLAQAWVSNPATDLGLVLLQEASSGYVVYDFSSELAWTPCAETQAPKLTLRYHLAPPPPVKATFQQDVNGYSGATATYDVSHNQLSGAIPPQLGHLTALRILGLGDNDLSGGIPPQLSNLTVLVGLYLFNNQLSGIIPPELGDLTSVQYVNLSNNQLSGAIPSQLGSLPALVSLYLNNNHLSGSIPPELGNLAALQQRPSASGLPGGWVLPFQCAEDGTTRPCQDRSGPFAVMRPPPLFFTAMDLSSNQLSGPIPAELGKLRGLDGIDLSGNQLSGAPPAQVMLGFAYWWRNYDYNLLTIPDDPYFIYDYRTQTVPPTDLQVACGLLSADLTWTPIPYTGDGGYYEISYSRWPVGPFQVHGHTADKTAASYTVTGLPPGDIYYFRVRTFTPAHTYTEPDFRYFDNDFVQQSDLWSEYSAVVSNAELTPTPTATATETTTATETATETPTPTPTATPPLTLTVTPSATPTVTATAARTPTATVTPTPTPYRRWLPLIWQ